ncbi:RNA polymerase sigma factor [Mucilaginibacter terrae]|uniref:RNA polymerase sigma-70 factor (Family 1) n=1 Tax=Mucilaginibacter terrae TaxID=1955052 RepID=A0ABU3GNI4_9SPHI|nr:RNA polymerase sigma-70 factor [Mucilaginibacter terrae]MDT3401046.1 RNA polymerase sigma-70 factor (family 1) [Mucilaginibacter terrae]
MPEYKKLSDQELLVLIKDDDHLAYEEVYHRYYFLLFTHAYKKVNRAEEAKDVIQDIFTKLWSNRNNLSATNLAGYLYTAVKNKVFDLYAHERVKFNYVHAFQEYINNYQFSAADHLIREKQLRIAIDQEIEQLPPKMRRIFNLSRKEHLSHSEIAQQLETSENNVSKHINNAIRILKLKLGVISFLYLFIIK